MAGYLRRIASRLSGYATPAAVLRQHHYAAQRRAVDRQLDLLSRAGFDPVAKTVLVDAAWDNPNYWLRYSVLRAALGLSESHEVGVLGPYRARECRQTLRRFGVTDIVRLRDFGAHLDSHRAEARRLLASSGAAADILSWRLPMNFPAEIVYDGILKRESAASVDMANPRLVEHVAEALRSLAAVQRLIASRNFDLVILSHLVNFHWASIAWCAVQSGIPVLFLSGNYGASRITRVLTSEDIFDSSDSPRAGDFATLSPLQAEAMAEVGRSYLAKRRAGLTDDIAARFAFQRRTATIDRNSLCEQFGWDPASRIVAVYASNWFDYPHWAGMRHFRDFLDWLQTTLGVAVRHPSVNWLIKPHPLDEWYINVMLKDLMPASPAPHVRLAPDIWNGSSVMETSDALVTYHGTAGIEYAAMGKPVLLSDRGWYHDLGFAVWPKTRREYLDALTSEWWTALDMTEAARRALIFAGWYFCRPTWQDGFVQDDDSVQDPVYDRLPILLSQARAPIARETRLTREWFFSTSKHFHTYKMSQTDDFAW